MNKETLKCAYVEINQFRDKLGEIFFDANTTYEMV